MGELPRDEKGRFLKCCHYSPKTELKKGTHPPTEFKKRHIPWNKGRKASKELVEHLKKIGFKKRQNPWNKGMPCSEETKKKISDANKGHLSQMKGKRFPEETRRRMSEAKIGIIPWNKGKPWSKEMREKLSAALKGRTPWWKKRGMKQLTPLKSNTEPELRFKAMCEKYYLPFKHTGDGSFWIGKINPDFIHNNGLKIAIFIDGCYWHGCPIHHPDVQINKARDEKTNHFLAEGGWGVHRFWEHEIKSENADRIVLERLKAILK